MDKELVRNINRGWANWRLNEGVGGATVAKAMNAIMLFHSDFTKATFTEIFGEDSGPRMWTKFHQTKKGDLIEFWKYMDGTNRQIMADYIGKKY